MVNFGSSTFPLVSADCKSARITTAQQIARQRLGVRALLRRFPRGRRRRDHFRMVIHRQGKRIQPFGRLKARSRKALGCSPVLLAEEQTRPGRSPAGGLLKVRSRPFRPPRFDGILTGLKACASCCRAFSPIPEYQSVSTQLDAFALLPWLTPITARFDAPPRRASHPSYHPKAGQHHGTGPPTLTPVSILHFS